MIDNCLAKDIIDKEIFLYNGEEVIAFTYVWCPNWVNIKECIGKVVDEYVERKKLNEYNTNKASYTTIKGKTWTF